MVKKVALVFAPVVLLWPAGSSANPIVYNFTLTVTSLDCPTCPTSPIVGSVTFDPSTNSIGPWSFSAGGQTFMSSVDPNATAIKFSGDGYFYFGDGHLVPDGNSTDYDAYSVTLFGLSNKPNGTMYDDFTTLFDCWSACNLVGQ